MSGGGAELASALAYLGHVPYIISGAYACLAPHTSDCTRIVVDTSSTKPNNNSDDRFSSQYQVPTKRALS